MRYGDLGINNSDSFFSSEYDAYNIKIITNYLKLLLDVRAGRGSLLWIGCGYCLKCNLCLAKLMSPGYPTPLMQSCQEINLLHLVIGHGFKNLCFILNLNVSGFRFLLLVLSLCLFLLQHWWTDQSEPFLTPCPIFKLYAKFQYKFCQCQTLRLKTSLLLPYVISRITSVLLLQSCT